MCTYVYPVSVLALVVVACFIHPAPVESQCTTSYCYDDNDNGVSVLTVMVSQLQDTVKQLQQQLSESTELLQQQLIDSMEQQQKQLIILTETLAKQGNGYHVEEEKLLKRRLPARDCYDLQRDGNKDNGVYEVYPAKARKYVRVYCDMETDGGGWLVFQRRQDGSVDFYRNWADYKEGFGDLGGEFWLGNDNLNDITSQAPYVLRIDMEDFENESRYSVYSNFTVAPEGDKYKLTLGAYSGTAGDSFAYSAGMSFSTKDRENDVHRASHCAQQYKGAWWYNACHNANLNGLYLRGTHASIADGIEWYHWHGYYYSLKKVSMKLRP